MMVINRRNLVLATLLVATTFSNVDASERGIRGRSNLSNGHESDEDRLLKKNNKPGGPPPAGGGGNGGGGSGTPFQGGGSGGYSGGSSGFSSNGCFNSPSNWSDSEGKSCHSYTFNPSSCKSAVGLSNENSMGKSATEACCVCGGGEILGNSAPIPVTTPGSGSDNGSGSDGDGADAGDNGGDGGNSGNGGNSGSGNPFNDIGGGPSDGSCIRNGYLCIETETCSNCCSGKYLYLSLNSANPSRRENAICLGV